MLIEQRENMMIKILIQRFRLPGTIAKKNYKSDNSGGNQNARVHQIHSPKEIVITTPKKSVFLVCVFDKFSLF